MFRSAYVKLTAFYVITIFLISLIFSIWVYHEATRELEVGLTTRDRYNTSRLSLSEEFLRDRLEEGRARVVVNLVYFNLVLLGVGGVLSYWLARKTMQPIEQAMEAQNRFTADASHELRTPLAAMKMELEVALRDRKRTQQETEELLKSNLEEVNRLVELSEALLSLARNDHALEHDTVSLPELANHLEKRFSPLAAQKSIVIKNTVANKAMTVMTDKTSLEQIIAILIDNAIKYSPEKTTITLVAKKRKKDMRLSVQDQGNGIAIKNLKRVFDRFYRVDDARSGHHSPGSGLGLSIAHKLANDINAQISVKSTQKKGSIFTVTIPN